MNNLMYIILMTQPAQGQKGSGYSSLIFLALIIVVFYFFFIRPQMKKTKDQKKFREALKKYDKVITIGGLHGKIVEVRDTTFIIEVEGTRLKVEKSAIASGEPGQAEENK
jgi:preprotein translocase subunit YajC